MVPRDSIEPAAAAGPTPGGGINKKAPAFLTRLFRNRVPRDSIEPAAAAGPTPGGGINKKAPSKMTRPFCNYGAQRQHRTGSRCWANTRWRHQQKGPGVPDEAFS